MNHDRRITPQKEEYNGTTWCPLGAPVQRTDSMAEATAERSAGQPIDVQQRNVRSVLIDGLGVGLVSGVSTFLSVYLVRLGAPPFLVGLLTSLPALTGMLLAIPAGRFLQRQRTMVPWYSRGRFLVQCSYALMGLIPFLFGLQEAAWITVFIWAIVTIPQTVVNITFTVVMGAVAGPTQRQYLMSRRWSILGVTTAITVALVGFLLDRIIFPLNYQIIFMASFVGGMLSYSFSRRIDIPNNPPISDSGAQSGGLRETFSVLRTTPSFGNFVLASFVFNLGLMMAIPLFPLYWVRELNASDFWIGLINTVNNGVVMIGYFFWTAVTRRRGNVLVLRLSAFGLTLYPLLTALSSDVAPIVLFAALAGIFGAGLNLVLFDISLSTVPPEQIASYIAVYQMTTYVATLIAPLVGTLLGEQIGYAPALFLAAGLRLAGAILYTTLKVGETSEPPRRVEPSEP